MTRLGLGLALGVFGAAAWGQAPAYPAAGFVNASDYSGGPFAPNSVLSIFGSNMAWSAQAITSGDIQAGRLPTMLNGVEVVLAGWPAPILYVSPSQINFLIPINCVAGTVTVRVVREGVTGPEVPITLIDAAPALFDYEGYAIAQKWPDYSLIAPDSPAAPGDVVILYATGLGNTQNDPATPDQIPQYGGKILLFNELEVYLNGEPLDPADVLWAGFSPGNAGLYQVNLQLPEDIAPNPEIRLLMGTQTSAGGIDLAVQTGDPSDAQRKPASGR
ncbi:MAG: hypothetical protein ABSF25_10430 [Bryobacteraceae bacterium]|jgi:uncharacterized protein (TIGR03437 family)